MRHATRTGVQEQIQLAVHELHENALGTNGISWISASSTKLLGSGERDFELVWLQEEDSLNIR